MNKLQHLNRNFKASGPVRRGVHAHGPVLAPALGVGKGGEEEREMRASSSPPFWANSRGYSAFQYILRGLAPETNRCASRFAADSAIASLGSGPRN